MYGSLFYVLPILAVIAKTVFRAVLPLLIGCMIAYVVKSLCVFTKKDMQEYAVWQPLRPYSVPYV